MKLATWNVNSLKVRMPRVLVCPTDLDVYDPAAFVGDTHVTEPERERFRALLEAGTVDAFASSTPTSPASPGGTTARATSTARWDCAATPS